MTNKHLDAYSDRILAVVENLEGSEKLFVLQKAMYAIAERHNIHPAKIANGTMGESIVCQQLGYKWNGQTVHGHDSQSETGQNQEIKAPLYRKNKNVMVNISYKMPERTRNKGQLENPQVYVERVYRKLMENDGGHIWVARKGTDIVYKWELDCKKFAEFIKFRLLQTLAEKPEEKSITYNFGCKPCGKCFQLHRIDHIVRCVNAGLLNESVKRVQNCR